MNVRTEPTALCIPEPPARRLVSIVLGLLLLSLAAAACDDSGGDDDAIDTSTTDAQDTTQADGDAAVEDTLADGDTTDLDDVRIPDLDGDVTAVYDDDGILHLRCATDADCIAALGYFHARDRFFFMEFTRLSLQGQLGTIAHVDGALGDGLLAVDVANRHFMSTPDGGSLAEAMVDELAPAERTLVQRYTDGINAFLADARAGRNGAELSRELTFGLLYPDHADNRAEGVRDWTNADTMAVALGMFSELARNDTGEIFLADAAAAFGGFDPELVADVITLRSALDVATIPASGEVFGFDQMGRLDGRIEPMDPAAVAARLDIQAIADRLRPSRALFAEARRQYRGPGGMRARMSRIGQGASNNWAVNASVSESGNAILANDPHLKLGNPSIWYPAELDAVTPDGSTGTFHCAGGTIPGLPVFLSGHCEHVAWGVTTANWDMTDVYRETLNADGTAVVTLDGEVPITDVDVDFMRAGETVTQTLRYVPHHGPIVAIDEANGMALSVRWTLHDGSGARDVKAIFDLMRATNVQEAGTALSGVHGANQNFVVADDQGQIGWFPYVRIPRRDWDWSVYPPWMVLPGDGSTEWSGFHTAADIPTMIDPAAGFIATANQDLTGAFLDGDTSDARGLAQVWGKAPGFRMQRIVDLLEAGGTAHSTQTLLDIQADTHMLLGEIIVPEIEAAAAGATLDPGAQQALDRLSSWEFTCPTGLEGIDPATAEKSSDPVESRESIACTIFHMTWYEIVEHTLADEAAAAGLDVQTDSAIRKLWRRAAARWITEAITSPMVLNATTPIWDDRSTTGEVETKDDVILQAFTDAVESLSAPVEPPDGEPAGLGPDQDDWRWGLTHTLSLSSEFNSFDPDLTAFNEGPYANDGGLFTVDVAAPVSPSPDSMAHQRGASIRTVIEMTPDGPVMSFQMPGGTNLDRGDELYNQLADEWVRNEPILFRFGPDAVQSPIEEITVRPAP